MSSRLAKAKAESSEEEEEELLSMKGSEEEEEEEEDDRKPAAKEEEDDDDDPIPPEDDGAEEDSATEVAADDEVTLSTGSTPGNQYSGYLNFTVKAHAEVYKLAIMPLSTKLYDLMPAGLLNFVENVKDRADLNGWSGYAGIFTMVTMDEKGNDVVRSVLDSYASIPLEEIQVSEMMALTQKRSRAGQDTGMVFQCLMASITPGAQERVRMHVRDYTLDGKRSGVCLFKVITRLSSANYNGTVTVLRNQLQKLDTWVTSNGDNIIALNQFVRETLARLASYGQESLDMIPNLFRGYEQVKNTEFKQYISWKKQVYDEGTDPLTHDALMNCAEIKYTGLVEQGQWEQTNDDKNIVALTAQVKRLTQQIRNKKGEGKKTKSKVDRKRGDRKPSARKTDPEWLRNQVAPAGDRLTKPRPFNGKIWWWCSKETSGKCDGKWRLHKPSDCKGFAAKRTEASAKRVGEPTSEAKGSKTSKNTTNSTAAPAVASLQLASSDSE
jgi:hypothetical protein